MARTARLARLWCMYWSKLAVRNRPIDTLQGKLSARNIDKKILYGLAPKAPPWQYGCNSLRSLLPGRVAVLLFLTRTRPRGTNNYYHENVMKKSICGCLCSRKKSKAYLGWFIFCLLFKYTLVMLKFNIFGTFFRYFKFSNLY